MTDPLDADSIWLLSIRSKGLSPATIYRTRQRLVEEGFEAVLARKHSPNSARPRIFDGAAEAKLIALMCSPPPKGRAKWTLRLLEDTVVELCWKTPSWS